MATKPHLTHVALWTRDIERSVEFYRRYCQLEIVHERGEGGSGRVVWVGESRRRPRFVIVLIESRYERSPESSFAHFGFSCRSRGEVDQRATMARGGGVLAAEPHDAGPIVGYFCIVTDPDGNSVEFSYGQTIDPGFFRASRTPLARPPGKPRAKPRPKRPPRRRPSRPRRR